MPDIEKYKRLKNLEVHEISLVDVPAVPKAIFLISKRSASTEEVKNMELVDLDKRIAPYGYTGSAAGATSPAHIHDYYVSLYFNPSTGLPEVDGYVCPMADHNHRITAESYARGETEESDGHIHTLMVLKEARALIETSKRRPQLEPLPEFSEDQVARLDQVAARFRVTGRAEGDCERVLDK